MFKYTKRIIAAFVCLTVLFSLCGCGGKSVIDTISNLGKDKEPEPIDEIGFTVPYIRTDSLDPYKLTNSMNKYISGLIYDSLFKVDETFKETAVIAESYTVVDKKLTVKIKNGLKFTDGTPLTANDVVYSFNQAKASVTYATYLENIDSASTDSTYTAAFTLRNTDKSEAANLIFPIVKKGSYDKTASEDMPSDSDDEESTTTAYEIAAVDAVKSFTQAFPMI